MTEGTTPPTDTERAIMDATYRALTKHGYRNLTMQAIADEFDLSRGTLHYHYDSKQDLLVAFLEYLLDRFDRRLEIDETAGPRRRLEGFLHMLLFGGEESEIDHWELTRVMLEIRAEAPHEPEYQRQLTENFTAIRDRLADIIRDGVEIGRFRPVDPDITATTLLATVMGGRIYQVTLEIDDVAETTQTGLKALVDAWLVNGPR